MNFTELKTELAARGFDYLTDIRRGQYVNWARAELDDFALWPYRLATSSGPTPLTIADLGVIDDVLDTSNSNQSLLPSSHAALVHQFRDLSTPGIARFFYVDGGVKVYPAGAPISVRYFKVPPDLTGTDVPLAPVRWHRAIVDIAVRMVYRDSDNHDAAAALQAQIDRDLGLMMQALLITTTEPGKIELRERW